MNGKKSYNKIPRFLPCFLAYAALLESVSLVFAPLLLEQVGRQLPLATACAGALPSLGSITAFLAVIAIPAAAGIAAWSQSRFHNGVWLGEKPSPNRSYGSARIISRPASLKRAFKTWRKGKGAPTGLVVGGIGNSCNKLLVDEITHSLILGGTGSGKTTSVLLPSLGNLISSGVSFIVSDPKGECFAVTGAYAERHGYEVVCIDFSSATTSDGWHPLQPAIDCASGSCGRTRAELPGEIRILADTLIPPRHETSPIWTQAARILFSGLAAYVIENDDVPVEAKNLSTVAALAAMEQETLQGIVAELPPTSTARPSLEAVANSPAETFGGFRVNLNTILNVYADPSISGMLHHSDFRIEDFLDGKVALYIKFNSSTQAFDALVSALLSQLIDGLRRLAENRCNGTLPRQVYLLLEEFPQIPKIPNLQKHLSIIRGAGLHMALVAQDRSQIEATYREDAPAILNNLDTTLFLAANDLRTCEHYSKLLGSYTVETESHSTGRGPSNFSSSSTTAFHEARLMRPEELSKWGWHAGHLVIKNGQAYACSSLPISKTFVGDELGLGGKEPDAEKRLSMQLPRPIKHETPAPVWHWKEHSGKAPLEELALAIDSVADPRFMK